MRTWRDEMETLARERGPALVGYAYVLTGDVHSAQDLVQEALVRTFSRRHRDGGVERLEAYVRRAVLNAYLDRYRRRRSWIGVQHLAVEDRSPSAPDVVAAEREDLRAALRLLSPRERACVVLRYVEDLAVVDVATALGLSDGAVKRYLSDARSKLGDILRDRDDTVRIDVATTERTTR